MWGCSSAGRAPRSQRGGRRFDPDQLHQPLPKQLQSGVLRRQGGSGFRLRAQTPARRLKFDPAQLHQPLPKRLQSGVLRRQGGSGFRLRAQAPARRLKFDPAQLHQPLPKQLQSGVLRPQGGSGFRLRAQAPARRLKFDPAQLHQSLSLKPLRIERTSSLRITEETECTPAPARDTRESYP